MDKLDKKDKLDKLDKKDKIDNIKKLVKFVKLTNWTNVDIDKNRYIEPRYDTRAEKRSKTDKEKCVSYELA